MALSSDVQSILVDKRVKSVDFAVKTHVEVGDEKQVEKVLSIKATVAVKDQDAKERELLVSGNVYLDVVYLSSQGTFERLNQITEFSTKVEGLFKNAHILANVIDTKSKITQNGLELDVAITADVFNIFNENVVVPEVTEDMFVKYESQTINSVVDKKNELFTVLDEINLPENVNGVINVNTTAVVKNVDIQNNVIVVDFDLMKDFTYVYGDENLIKLERKTQTYKQEFVNNFIGEVKVFASVDEKSVKIEIEKSEDVQNSIVNFVHILGVEFVAIGKQSVNVITDVFSNKNEVLLSKECFMLDAFEEKKLFNEKISASFNTKNDIQEIVDITNVKTIKTVQKTSELGLEIEGVIVADVIYKDFNLGKILSQSVTSPFNVILSAECNEFESLVQMRVIGQKSKGYKNIEVILDGYFDVSTKKTANICFVSTINVKEAKDLNLAPISVYMCDQDEDDFEIAKGLNVAPELIKESIQNQKNNGFVSIFREI